MQTKRLSTLYRIGLILLVLFAIYKFGRIFFNGGTDPFAETYELNVSEEEVIKAINALKKQQPDLIPPAYLKDVINIEGGRNDAYKYIVYFYFKKENKVLRTWTRSNKKNGTTLAFVEVNDNLNLKNWEDGMNGFGWKTINEDYWFWENRKLKKQFEERIVSKIKIILEAK
ncbi:hypothetical protein [Flavobacterium psychrotolerans]|uniref:DUF4468 domain-containing protein n=1 Tax=Flavobacterium psychrotolerans TaxID=2169410 RepID=A0A2U1JN83_9FLAO|nr:hypothetical protein [Flavobacterium psychrotolerans]PWA06439.1 hypothetical protein DB895_03180 [Flavobacterium psychrotolerans]